MNETLPVQETEEGGVTPPSLMDHMREIWYQPISFDVWSDKYRQNDEQTMEDSLRRVAYEIMEDEPEELREKTLRYMLERAWNPGGRVHAGAGTSKNVTLQNCYLLQTIQDSMSSIMETLSQAAITQQAGGGIGMDFSTLRPNGALVKGHNTESSGPVSFMHMWNSMCGTIMSAGNRRGAQLSALAVWHPDIIEFITAKQTAGVLTNFNVSVAVTDPFMEAVRNDLDWDLVFNKPRLDGNHVDTYETPTDHFLRDKRGGNTLYVYKRMKARELWDMMIQSTYEYAEPGVLFIDRINQLNNLNYCEDIRATNPCVSGETWVETEEGARQVTDLVGKKVRVRVDGKFWDTTEEGFFKSGTKATIKIETKCGRELVLTQDHLIMTESSSGKIRWVEAGKLLPDDQIVLSDHRSVSYPAFTKEDEKGYLMGNLVADGHIKSDNGNAILEIWNTPGTEPIKDFMEEVIIREFPARADFKGWQSPITDRNQPSEYYVQRMRNKAFDNYTAQLGLKSGNKKITPEIEKQSTGYCRHVIAGMFDADGSPQGSEVGGYSVRLSQICLPTLRTVQRMLGRLGINSTIYQYRRAPGWRLMPDGKGGKKKYWTQATHELVIHRENVRRFAALIPTKHAAKNERIAMMIRSNRRLTKKEPWRTKIRSTQIGDTIDVYDVQVPDLNFFDGNGVLIHNCGEIPLPPNGNCNLGAVNLAVMVRDPFTPRARIAWERLGDVVRVGTRFLDNVLDKSKYPLDAQVAESKAKRRTGLGITGLANLFMMLGLRYGSEESLKITDEIMSFIAKEAYLESSRIAGEKGSFGLFDKEKFLKSPMVKKLDERFNGEISKAIKENGIRNGVLLTIAPTGTTSIYYGYTSAGLEPVFQLEELERKVLRQDGGHDIKPAGDFGMMLYNRLTDGEKQDWMVSAMELSVEEHLSVQEVCQRWIDSSISKTINCPKDMPYEDFQQVYMSAYDRGLKGCTTYRPSGVRGSVYVEKDEGKEVENEGALVPAQETPKTASRHVVEARPRALSGTTYKVRWPNISEAFYVTINDVVDENGERHPFELFINSKSQVGSDYITALTRTISAILRQGRDAAFLIDELTGIQSEGGGMWKDGQYIPSLMAAFGHILREHFEGLGVLEPKPAKAQLAEKVEAEEAEEVTASSDIAASLSLAEICPSCGQRSYIPSSGCMVCSACGFSACG